MKTLVTIPKGIALRIAALCWTVTLLTLIIFVAIIVPEQKHEFALNLESKARGVAVSIKGVAAGAAVSEDYSVVVEQAMQVLAGDDEIDYVVMTKNDGFSIVVDRSKWATETLDASWRPPLRLAASSIGVSPLFGRRVFQYAFPFDYSGVQWGWIHIGLSLKAYDQSVSRIYASTALLVLLCGTLSLFMSVIYAARIVRPIHVLRGAVEKVAQGDLHARAHLSTHDEIEQLADAFNGMAQTILGRNQILESVSFAAEQFLRTDDLEAVACDVLKKVSLASGASRAWVVEHVARSGQERAELHQEYVSPGTCSSAEQWGRMPWSHAAMAAWMEALKRGRVVSAKRNDLPRALLDAVHPDFQSTICLPIMLNGSCWGAIGLEDFVHERDWGEAERDSLRAVADMLGASLARQRVQRALVDAKRTLEQRVLERTAELEEQVVAKDRAHKDLAAAQQRLIDLSREAGMAEIATGVLHNVGNVLNSVNVSATLVAGKVRESRVDNLVALINMLEQHSGDLQNFLAVDPKGQRILPYLAKLGGHFRSERDNVLGELELLSSHVGHIKQIVATQQSYAKVSGLVENVNLADLVEDAIRIMELSLVRHGITLIRDFEDVPQLATERHKILQILLNLFRNAKQAMHESHAPEKKELRIEIRRIGAHRVRLAVEDTGVGLPAENLTRIFGHGFTTKADGHGFGLHSCALAASQMGGSLRAESEGLGRGATFVLELPIKSTAKIENFDSKEKHDAAPGHVGTQS